jgi:transcriptional repressor NrdR
MICPACQRDQDRVLKSRNQGDVVRRRRECLMCGHRWNTWEMASAANGIASRQEKRP